MDMCKGNIYKNDTKKSEHNCSESKCVNGKALIQTAKRDSLLITYLKILLGHAVTSILFKLFFLMVAANLQHEEKLGNSG